MFSFFFKLSLFVLFVTLLLFSFFTPNTGLQAVFTNWHVSFHFYSGCVTCACIHTHTHTLYHIRSEMHLVPFSNFNIAEIAICLAILDLMKYGMDIHIYIYGSLSLHSLCYKKNLIMFYLFFCIFLSLLICGNPSKKSDKTLILFKHVL